MSTGVTKVMSSDLEKALPGYLQSQRWFRAKARKIASVMVRDRIAVKPEGATALIIDVAYESGQPDTYLLPVIADEAGTVAPGYSDALQSDEFRAALLAAIARSEEFKGEAGVLRAVRTPARENLELQLSSKVSRAEQSNTSIIFGDKYILKLFRKLESGLNPDIEIGRFLTEHAFEHTPAVLGGLEYVPNNGDVMNAAILQAFVPNQGDAWKYTLEQLEHFYANVSGDAPALHSYHPFELLETEANVGFVEAAQLLGRRTAQMHSALAEGAGNPDFEPELFTPEFREIVRQEMEHEADRAFALLREKGPGDPLIAKEADVRSRLEIGSVKAPRIRHHGDYHLGQVLWTGEDFVIIDFEGEPARDLAARRLKTLAMRDVAGMIRSFSYAAFAALPSPEKKAWAPYWAALVGAAFLGSYLENAGPYAGASRDEQRRLFDAFVLQKALYEVSYELNNRPDWVDIPLQGIATLLND